MYTSVYKKAFILVWCLTCMGLFSSAQDLKGHLGKGDRLYQKKDYENALKNYIEALPLDPGNAEINFRIGVSYFHSEKVSTAVPYLEKAFNSNPEVDPNIDYYLAMAYQNDHQYARASKHFEEFKIRNKNLSGIADQKIIECSTGDSLMRHPADVEIQPFDQELNTGFAEFAPLVSPDGKTLIFTSNRSSDDYKIKSRTNFEDVYITEKQGGEWSQPQLISPHINVKYNDAAASLSHDGKTLFLYYEYGNGDIYTSTLEEDGSWTKPVPLNRFINHPQYRETAACVSPDGKQLYFSSNRPGGKGGFDIYVSTLDPNGQWGRPSNLGSAINTRLNEESPFLHSDGATLYFSSNGHPTLGNNDIFKSEWKDGTWTRPINLGYPINSSAYNDFFTLSDDGQTGYYSALREGEPGNSDLYVIHFPESKEDHIPDIFASATTLISDDFVDPVIKDHKDRDVVTKLSGSVIDIDTSAPLSATIRLVDNTSNKVISRLTTDETGNFELLIPHSGNYGVTTEKKGYLFNSANFDLPPAEKYTEVDTKILMVKAEVGSKMILKNIFFDVNQSELKPESLTELENIRDLLRQNSNLRVQINGHTDDTGQQETNLALSLRRAQLVVQYLIKQAIVPGRLKARGFGSERPLVSNDDEAGGRQINRRTEIEIIGFQNEK